MKEGKENREKKRNEKHQQEKKISNIHVVIPKKKR